MPGIEPGTFHMQSERSTAELHPLPRLKKTPGPAALVSMSLAPLTRSGVKGDSCVRIECFCDFV